MEHKNGTSAMKWSTVSIAFGLFAISTIIRLWRGQEVDRDLCWAIVAIAGLVFGAPIAINLLKK